MSFRLVSISKDLKYRLEMAARLSKTNELSVVTLAFEKGLESIKNRGGMLQKIPYAQRSFANSLIEIPTRFDASIEEMATMLGIPEFRAIHIALELGVKPILDGKVKPVPAPAPVRKKPQAPIKAKQEKIPAPPKKDPPPVTQAALTTPPPTLSAAAPIVEQPPAPPVILAATSTPARSEPVPAPQMVHLFLCGICNKKIEVPSKDYHNLKRGLAAARLKRPKCKKHGGYQHLLGSQVLKKIAS